MKPNRTEANRKAPAWPTLRFKSHRLTAFGGIVVLQEPFGTLSLTDRLKDVLRGRQMGESFRPLKLFLQLISRVLLDFRSLRERVADA